MIRAVRLVKETCALHIVLITAVLYAVFGAAFAFSDGIVPIADTDSTGIVQDFTPVPPGPVRLQQDDPCSESRFGDWRDIGTEPEGMILSPMGGVMAQAGSWFRIRWMIDRECMEGHVKIYYSVDSGNNWMPINAPPLPPSGSFDWLVPPETFATVNARIKVVWYDDDDPDEEIEEDESDDFYIRADRSNRFRDYD